MKLTDPIIKKAFSEMAPISTDLTIENIKKILKDIDIDAAVKKLERATSGKNVLVSCVNEEVNDVSIEINKRFKGIKWNRIIKHLITARYFGYSALEIVYNRDFSIKTLTPILVDYLNYNKGKWTFKVSNTEVELNKDKFLLNINGYNPAQAMGVTIFESINESFNDKLKLTGQLRGVSQAYGDTIVIYPYLISSTDEEKKAIREAMKKESKKDAIGVPFNSVEDAVNLSKMIQFVRLSDLDPHIYTELMAVFKEKIIQNILGGTLTMEASSSSGTGTNALGNVHQESFLEIVKDITTEITQCLHQLIEIDSKYFGYEAKDYKFILEDAVTEEEIIEKEKKKEELKTQKVNNISVLSNSGYKLSTKLVAEILEIEVSDIQEKESANLLEFAKDKKKIKIEDLKVYTKKVSDKFDLDIEEVKGTIVSNMHNSILDYLKNIKKISDLDNISINFDSVSDMINLVTLRGYTDDAIEDDVIEFSEDIDNPFKLKYNEAISYFLNKVPTLYDNLDDINNETLEKVFYIKKSTDLEVTKKLYNDLIKSLETGGTFKEWKNNISTVVDKIGVGKNGYYLENVYRTNLLTAYNTGAMKHQDENKSNKPYGMYNAIDDSRTSDICKALDGKVYKLDSEFWTIYMPPNHFGCRSVRTTLSKEELSEYGLEAQTKISKEVKELENKLGSFKGSPLNASTSLKASIKQKEKDIEKLKNSGLKSIRTVEEAKKALTEDIGFILVENSFDKMDDYLIISNTQQLKKLEDRFGVIKKSSSTISSENRKNTMAYVTSSPTNPSKQNLSLCLSEYKNKNMLIAKTKKYIENNYYMPTGLGDYEVSISSLTHEYGHMLQNIMIKNEMELRGWTESESRKFVDETKKTIKARLKWYSDLQDEVLKKHYDEIKQIALEKNPDFKITKDNISEYGKYNYAEFFAEVFMNSQLSKPNELGEAMKEWLEKKGW